MKSRFSSALTPRPPLRVASLVSRLRRLVRRAPGVGDARLRRRTFKAAVCLALLALARTSSGATLPPGFTETRVAAGLQSPTAMAFAPDGRLFVCEQGGRLRVIKNGLLLPEPFLSVETDPTGERGLLGLAFDPDFSGNGYVYVYYTEMTTPRRNRVSRFKAEGDRSVTGSETLVFRLDDLSSRTLHNGGAMHFGPDGKLYVAVGENSVPNNAQSLQSLHGKMLRINPDGSIPEDNPFFAATEGDRRAIWALGLRNPFTFAFQPGSSRLFINDVGEGSWEEINEGAAGANYGWPASEGAIGNPAHRSPFFAYPHGTGPEAGCAVTGGTFYNPHAAQFPASFKGKYFFADFCGGWIRVLDPADGTATGFASGTSFPVALRVAPDGSLYYLARGDGSVYQVAYAGPGAPPVIAAHPSSLTAPLGSSVTFRVAASGEQPLTYRWQRDGADLPGVNSETLTLSSVTLADDGARFRCVVANAAGSVTSAEAVLRVTANRPPVSRITLPAGGSLYSAGETIHYAGEGDDPDEGALPASAFTWQVDFHHDTHVHPFLPAAGGARAGSFLVPAEGEKSPDVWYRVRLKVTDAGGLTHETFRDVRPRLARVTLRTEPAGLQVALDGKLRLAPFEFVGVVGVVRSVSAPQRQTLGGVAYVFRGWSDGGALTHDISTPAADAVLTAAFAPSDEPPPRAFRLSAPTYTAEEGAGRVAVTVVREGDLSGEASVEFRTEDGTASVRSDYVPVFTTLRFAPGEPSKTVEILITDGAAVEARESFNVELGSPRGGVELAAPSVAEVFVRDDDSAPSPNPVEEARFFVRQHYHDFLSREPDPEGLDFWTNEITSCGADTVCREVKRVNVSAAFFLSIEFQETGYLVYRAYKAVYGDAEGTSTYPAVHRLRVPAVRFSEFLRDTQGLGSGVVVGRGDWKERLEANKSDFFLELVRRPEFLARYPAALTAAEFVDALDRNAGGPLTRAERDALVGQLASGGGEGGRASVVRSVAENATFSRGEKNRAFVLMEYFGYLRRNPDDPHDADHTGYDFWLEKLNEFGGNFIEAEMVKAFISSVEHRQRFGR